MAVRSLGTNANNSLSAVVWNFGSPQADIRAANNAILDDVNPRHPVAMLGGMGGFIREGNLFVPNRGVLQLRPGDAVAWDAGRGWVILVSSDALANGPWTLV